MEHLMEKLEGNKVKITFTVPAATFDEALEKAYLKMRGRINVPGFRKGKAPRKLIERMYGEGVFYDDAFELVFPQAYSEAIQANDIKPVSQPELSNVEQMKAGEDLKFACEVYVEPEVKLGEYKGLDVERIVRKITDAEIDSRIEQEQKRVARSIEVTDRAVENGDKVNLDYSGSVDGKKFDGGTAAAQTLLIGSGTFIPGFEEQLIGMNIGEEKDINVTFPEEYHAEELKGKAAVFAVKINGITKEELPALDDEFAGEVSDFDTFAEYRADIAKKLQDAADERATEAAKNALIQKVTENAEIDIPQPMVESKLDEMLEQMAWRMQQQGFTMKKYMELTGTNESQMRDMYREEAKNNLKTELVLDEIVKAENMQASDEDVDKQLGEYASAMNQTLDELKNTLSDGQKEYFSHRVCVTKVLDMLWENAKITDAEPSEAKPSVKEKAEAVKEEVKDKVQENTED